MNMSSKVLPKNTYTLFPLPRNSSLRNPHALPFLKISVQMPPFLTAQYKTIMPISSIFIPLILFYDSNSTHNLLTYNLFFH